MNTVPVSFWLCLICFFLKWGQTPSSCCHTVHNQLLSFHSADAVKTLKASSHLVLTCALRDPIKSSVWIITLFLTLMFYFAVSSPFELHSGKYQPASRRIIASFHVYCQSKIITVRTVLNLGPISEKWQWKTLRAEAEIQKNYETFFISFTLNPQQLAESTCLCRQSVKQAAGGHRQDFQTNLSVYLSSLWFMHPAPLSVLLSFTFQGLHRVKANLCSELNAVK